MESPIIIITGLIQYFILSIIVGGIIFNISFQLKKHLIFSLIGCLMVYIVRNIFIMLSLPIGMSTLINLFLTIFIFKYVFLNRHTQENESDYINTPVWKTAIIASFLIFIVTVINEILTLEKTLIYLHTDIQTMLKNTMVHFEVGMIQNLGLLIIMGIIYIIKKYFIDRRIAIIEN